MKVKDLIEMLEGCDEDAEVILGIQPSWPFEHSIRGIVQRQDFIDCDPDESDDSASVEGEANSFTTKGRLNDVIICEGGQIRYGSRDMFDAC